MNTEISGASLIELETYADKLHDHNGNHIDVVTEYAANDGKRIDWKYWFSLPFWKPQEAAYLLNLYDPKTKPAHPNRKAELGKITELAEREQRAGILPPNVSPAAWIEWARGKGITVPSQFAGIAAQIEAATVTTTPGDDWKVKARAIADEFFDIDTKNNCRDSLKGYSSRVMDAMQERSIKGQRGIIDNSATIMREALQGEKWWKNKLK